MPTGMLKSTFSEKQSITPHSISTVFRASISRVTGMVDSTVVYAPEEMVSEADFTELKESAKQVRYQ